MEATVVGDNGNLAQRRMNNMEADDFQKVMNRQKNDRKHPQRRNGGNHLQQQPRIILHVPEWFPQLSIFNRGLKLMLAGVVLVACAGTVVYLNRPPPDLSSYSSLVFSTSHDMKLKSQYGGPAPDGTTLPLILSDLADSNHALLSSDMPFFFDVPDSSSFNMKRYLGECMGLIQALDAGSLGVLWGEGTNKTSLKLIQTAEVGTIVNVDTYTLPGIDRAQSNQLIQSDLITSIASDRPYSIANLFSASIDHRGRTFTLLRHPVQRVIQYRMQMNKDPLLLESTSLQDYYSNIKGEQPEFNYLTKILTQKESSEFVTWYDMNRAKEILRRKVLIGLYADKAESLRRFATYFGWNNIHPNSEFCENGQSGWSSFTEMDSELWNPSVVGMDTWNFLVEKNSLDMDLYEYAKSLFVEQQKLV